MSVRWIGASLLGVVCLAAGGAEAPGGAPVASADVVLCPATRDVWISAVDGEQRYNMGAARRLKLKQWQELALIDFDVSALAGARVRRAALVVTPVGGARLGLNGGSDLAWLSVSTIAHEWTEGRSWRYAVDRSGHGATFLESSHGRDDWGFEGARVWDVTLGNGNTLRQDGRLEPATSAFTGEPALRLELDPRLAEALVAGASHGLLLMDGSTDVGTNAFIASRESGDGPYLEVEVEPSAAAAPAPPIDVVALPAPGWATEVRGAAEVTLRAPDGAFSYNVQVDGRAVERWQIPFAGKPGELQTLRLLDLEPDRPSRLEIEAVGATGRRSGAARVSVRSSGALAADPLPPLPHLAAGSPPRLGRATVFALPELMRLDPVGGGVLGERGVGEIRRSNPVWSGADRRVVLSAARGEIVGFQIAIEGTADGIRIEPGGLGRVASGSPDAVPHEGGAEARVDEVIGASHYRLWRTWHVDGYPEYALPLSAPVVLPSADNPVPDQSVQTIAVDLHVPTNAAPGRYSGEIVVVTSEGRLRLDVSLRVYDVALPRRPTFLVELNTYRGPGRAGSERFIDSFRLAHYHRATINRVPYTHRGAVYDDWSPKLDGGGRIVDWGDFDRHLGGLLDGSWFADSPRAGVPAPVLYLPLFEGWPLDYRDHYRPGPGVPLRVREPLAKLRHDTLALPLEEALDPRFKRAFVRAVRAFYRHIEAKGWDRTLFQVYLNNKPRYGYTLWTLDEPFEYLDWAAVNAFARLTRQALQQPELYAPGFQESLLERGADGDGPRRPTVLFRADVSRPMWMGSVADGLYNALYVGSDSLPLRRLLRAHRERMPALIYAYGTPPPVEAGGQRVAAWCLEAFSAHAEGVLPWQSIAGPEALETPTATGLVVDGGPLGHAIASLRLHALRRGAQDVELLRLLGRQEGLSRDQLAHLVATTLGEGSPLPPSPSWKDVDGLTTSSFYRLKRGILERLETGGERRP